MNTTASTLANPENKNIVFKVFTFDNDKAFSHVQRIPSYSIVLITEGEGKLEFDLSEEVFHNSVMMFFSPYQSYKISGSFKGVALNFHSDFLCVYKHHQEIACNGVLFNTIYLSPILQLELSETTEFKNLTLQMLEEMQSSALAQYEML